MNFTLLDWKVPLQRIGTKRKVEYGTNHFRKKDKFIHFWKFFEKNNFENYKIEWFSKIVQVGTFPENFDQNWRPQESYGNEPSSVIVWEIKVFVEGMKIHHYRSL